MPEQAYLDVIETNRERDPLAALPPSTLADIELQADCTPAEVGAVYEQWGCCVVRGLLADCAPAILEDAEAMAAGVRAAGYESINNAYVPEGGQTGRDKQIMLFCPSYTLAASHFQAAIDPRMLDLLEAMIGPSVELFGQGMCMYKEPGGGMEKALHQDAPYFYHRDHTVVTGFIHLLETNNDNGALHVVPGSFKLGLIEHVDTPSHLALPASEFPLECAMPIYGRPGDVVLFNYLTVHGSGLNYSDKPRPALCTQYRSGADEQVWRFASLVEHLGIAVSDEVRNQRGALARGRRII